MKTNIQALLMSESNEWYTPRQYLEAARLVMGAIDLDPASNAFANQIVKATRYYTKEDNGLSYPWTGRVWLNPPYGKDEKRGRSNQEIWSHRLIAQYRQGNTTEAVLLVNAVTGNTWFQALWEYPICFTNHRIRFYNAQVEAGQPTHSNVLVYLGKNEQKFIEVFRKFGRIVRAIDTPLEPVNLELWSSSEVAS